MATHSYFSPSPFAAEAVSALAAFIPNDPNAPIEHLPIIRISETRAIVAHLPIRAKQYHFADVISIVVDRSGTIIAQSIDRPSTIEHLHGKLHAGTPYERSSVINELESLGVLVAMNSDGETTMAIHDDAISTKHDIIRYLSSLSTWRFISRA